MSLVINKLKQLPSCRVGRGRALLVEREYCLRRPFSQILYSKYLRLPGRRIKIFLTAQWNDTLYREVDENILRYRVKAHLS